MLLGRATTRFLDYGTAAKRHNACCEELRLGSRYSLGLYLDIVPITFEDGQIRMDGDAQPIEFAVRMRRFEEECLLSRQLARNQVSVENMVQFATTLAGFHSSALRLQHPQPNIVSRIFDQAKQNFDFLRSEPLLRQDPVIQELENWTVSYFANHHIQIQRTQCVYSLLRYNTIFSNIILTVRRWVNSTCAF